MIQTDGTQSFDVDVPVRIGDFAQMGFKDVSISPDWSMNTMLDDISNRDNQHQRIPYRNS